MFCTSMVDVANEFGVPSYLFYTSSAGILALGFEMLCDKNEYDVSESDFEDSEAVLDVQSLTRRYPVKCLPYALASKLWRPVFVNQAKNFREMKGMLINTVAELEPNVLKFFWRGDHLGGVARLTITAEEIERGIKCLMEEDSNVRKRVKEVSEKCHLALMDGGSSRIALQSLLKTS